MDQLELLKAWTHQYLQNLLKRNQNSQQPLQICTLVIIALLVEMKKTVSGSGMDLALLEYFVDELYFTDQSELKQSSNPLAAILAKQVRLVQNYAQLIIRIIILGLSTQVQGSSIRSTKFSKGMWKQNFRKLFTTCQLEMSFIQTRLTTSQQGHQFAMLLLGNLEELGKEFRVVEFYQKLGAIWEKLEVYPLISWADKGIQGVKCDLSQKKVQQSSKKSEQKGNSSFSQPNSNRKPRQTFIPKTENRRPSILSQVLQAKKNQSRKSMPRTLHQERKHIIRTPRVDTNNILSTLYEQGVLCEGQEGIGQSYHNQNSVQKSKGKGFPSRWEHYSTDTNCYAEETPEKKKRNQGK